MSRGDRNIGIASHKILLASLMLVIRIPTVVVVGHYHETQQQKMEKYKNK